MVSGEPDWTFRIEFPPIDVVPEQENLVVVRPTGEVSAYGSLAATTTTYQNVVSLTPTNGKTFRLAKIKVSVEKASWVKMLWAAAQVGPEILMDDKTVLLEHFPWGYLEAAGDGSKQVVVQAKLYSASGRVDGEIVGEET